MTEPLTVSQVAERLAVIREYGAILDADIERLRQAREMLGEKEARYLRLLAEYQGRGPVRP